MPQGAGQPGRKLEEGHAQRLRLWVAPGVQAEGALRHQGIGQRQLVAPHRVQAGHQLAQALEHVHAADGQQLLLGGGGRKMGDVRKSKFMQYYSSTRYMERTTLFTLGYSVLAMLYKK